MSIHLSPEILVAKYIKSATNGRVISVRLRRILTLLIIPIWVVSFVIVIPSYVKAFKAIPKYRTLQKLKKKYGSGNDDNNCYGGHVHASWNNDGESIHQCACFNVQFWRKMGLTDADHRDSVEGLFSFAEQTQENELYKFWYLPYFLLLFVVAPWVILRLVFWIIDAKEVEQISKPK